jgi:hypothetical protein
MKYINSIILCFIALSVCGQTDNKNLNEQLGIMKEAFMSKNYDTFADYTFPKVIDMMGGKEKMVNTTKNTIEKMESQGFVIESIAFENPSDFYNNKGDLQCVITQIMIMSTPNGKVENKTAVLAISSDDGENWNFFDTSGMPKASVQDFYTNMHPDLNLNTGGKKKLD